MSDNPTKEQRRELMRRAIAEAVRILREGGTGVVEFPDATTGELTRLEVDQEHAHELLAGFTDTRMIQIWEDVRAGNTLSVNDREDLRKWTAATVADAEETERERRTTSKSRWAHLTVIDGGKP